MRLRKRKDDVLSIIKRLHDEKGKTIIMITHYIEESIIADRIILMNKGRITAQGPPRKVLANEQLLAETGLEPPIAVHAWLDLKHSGYVIELNTVAPLRNAHGRLRKAMEERG